VTGEVKSIEGTLNYFGFANMNAPLNSNCSEKIEESTHFAKPLHAPKLCFSFVNWDAREAKSLLENLIFARKQGKWEKETEKPGVESVLLAVMESIVLGKRKRRSRQKPLHRRRLRSRPEIFAPKRTEPGTHRSFFLREEIETNFVNLVR